MNVRSGFPLMMTRSFGFIFLLLLFFPLVLKNASAAQLLKVVSLNFNSEAVLEDFPHQFIRDQRFAAMLTWIKQNDPDVLFIVEGWNHHSFTSIEEELALSAGYDYYAYVGMGLSPIFLDGNGILVKKKFHLDQTGALKLPHSSVILGNGDDHVLSLGSASWAVGGRITLDDGTHVYAYATHLISSKEVDRADQMKAINQLIESQMKENGEDWTTAHGLISGDFNSAPDTPGVTALLATGYQDTYALAHPNSSGCTFCSDPTSVEFNPLTIGAGLFPVQDVSEGNERIDYILERGPSVQVLASTRTFTTPIDGLWMSDHYGLTSTIAFGGVPNDVSLPYPNPELDRTGFDNVSTLIHVNPENFECESDSCVHLLPDQTVSAERGMTFSNDTPHKIKIRFTGDGTVWPKQAVTLSPGKVASFFFQPNHQFQMVVSHWFTRKKLIENFNSSLQ